jgi:hypothetical protein
MDFSFKRLYFVDDIIDGLANVIEFHFEFHIIKVIHSDTPLLPSAIQYSGYPLVGEIIDTRKRDNQYRDSVIYEAHACMVFELYGISMDVKILGSKKVGICDKDECRRSFAGQMYPFPVKSSTDTQRSVDAACYPPYGDRLHLPTGRRILSDFHL